MVTLAGTRLSMCTKPQQTAEMNASYCDNLYPPSLAGSQDREEDHQAGSAPDRLSGPHRDPAAAHTECPTRPSSTKKKSFFAKNGKMFLRRKKTTHKITENITKFLFLSYFSLICRQNSIFIKIDDVVIAIIIC